VTIEYLDVIRIVLAFLMPESQVAQLVMHYRVGPGSPTNVTDALDDINDVLALAWLIIDEYVAGTVLGQTLSMLKWNTTTKAFDGVGAIPVTQFDGTGVGEMLPHGVAGVLRFFTSVGRRQGRKFIPGLQENTQDEGSFTALVGTALALTAAAWDDNVTTTGGLLVPGVFRTSDESFEDFTKEVAANTIVGYQRRRKQGVGI